jgi:hypothetical protein
MCFHHFAKKTPLLCEAGCEPNNIKAVCLLNFIKYILDSPSLIVHPFCCFRFLIIMHISYSKAEEGSSF